MTITGKVERASAVFLRSLFILGLAGFVLVASCLPILILLYGIVSPEPAPDSMVARNRQWAFMMLPFAVGWFVICVGCTAWLIWFKRKRPDSHGYRA